MNHESIDFDEEYLVHLWGDPKKGVTWGSSDKKWTTSATTATLLEKQPEGTLLIFSAGAVWNKSDGSWSSEGRLQDSHVIAEFLDNMPRHNPDETWDLF